MHARFGTSLRPAGARAGAGGSISSSQGAGRTGEREGGEGGGIDASDVRAPLEDLSCSPSTRFRTGSHSGLHVMSPIPELPHGENGRLI